MKYKVDLAIAFGLFPLLYLGASCEGKKEQAIIIPRETTKVVIRKHIVSGEPCAEFEEWHEGELVQVYRVLEDSKRTKGFCALENVCLVPLIDSTVFAEFKNKAQAHLNRHVEFCDKSTKK